MHSALLVLPQLVWLQPPLPWPQSLPLPSRLMALARRIPTAACRVVVNLDEFVFVD